jgi:hypothetical protein
MTILPAPPPGMEWAFLCGVAYLRPRRPVIYRSWVGYSDGTSERTERDTAGRLISKTGTRKSRNDL